MLLLLQPLYGKLLSEQFDAVESLQVEYVEEEGFRVVCKKEGGLQAGKDVWLIDHMWTTTADKARQQLHDIDGLVDRLWGLADMDRRLEEERVEKRKQKQQAKAAAPAEAAPAPASGAAASASAAAAAAPSLELDEDSLSAIMSEASVSRERAVEAYTVNKGDLIQSITWCGGESERESQMKGAMMQMAEAQAAAEGHGDAAAAEDDDDDEPFDSSSLSLAEKANLLWPMLFRAGLVGSYFTTVLNDVSSASLSAEGAVQATLFVNDEIGSAVGQASHVANANALMAPLVCVTLGGVAFSLLWLTQDVKEGDDILIPKRPTIRVPGVPA